MLNVLSRAWKTRQMRMRTAKAAELFNLHMPDMRPPGPPPDVGYYNTLLREALYPHLHIKSNTIDIDRLVKP